MRKKSEIEEEEKALFRAATKGAIRHHHNKIVPERITAAKKSKKATPEIVKNPLNLYDNDYTDEVSCDDLLEFHRGGLQHKVLRKFRQGQYNADAILDLHGMRVTEARDALSNFLMHCMQKKIKHVLIIHGKGRSMSKPILKNKVNQWLRQIESVIAFCSATHRDGRSGAVYVLLKGSLEVE